MKLDKVDSCRLLADSSPGKLKLLVVTDKAVYPPIGGAALRNWQTINLLMGIGEVATFSVGASNSEQGCSPPGVPRWMQFKTTGRTGWQRFMRRFWWARQYGNHWADLLYSREIAGKLKEMILDFKPDVIVIEQIWLHRYLPVITDAGCRVVYDAHNCEGRLAGDLARLRGSKCSAWSRRLKSSKIQAIERRIVRGCDQVWTCSDQDAESFRSLYGQNFDIYVIPNGIDVELYSHLLNPASASGRGNYNILFAGTFSYPPNAAAAALLINEIYPRLRKLIPNCRLLLVGSNPNQMMENASREVDGVVVTGRIPDVIPYLGEANIVVVPLTEGGGTRLKILEAFAAGVPVVSTSKGAEGINAIDGIHLMIRDEIEDLVAAIVELSDSASLGNSLAIMAQQLVSQKYSWQAVSRQASIALRALLASKMGATAK